MADLEVNFMHLQLMHESLSRFSESFASFLYGLNMNAFCVDFPEVGTLPRTLTGVADIYRHRSPNHSRERKKQRRSKVEKLLQILLSLTNVAIV